jgi:hypothetical protein
MDSCVAIGYAALEQGGLSTNGISRCIGIGYQANRWNGTQSSTNCDDNCGVGYQSGSGLGYSDSNSARNCTYGSYVLSGAVGNSNNNSVFGYNSMSSFSSSGRSYNSCVGSSSLINCVSDYNSCLGYDSAANMLNTVSTYNTFIGAQVCPTQSGAIDVLTNCSFFGAKSDVASSGSYTNSTCLGYNSRITGNNQIILGTSAQTTYPMGGLNIPASTTMTLLGNLVANGLTITPTIMGYIQGLTSSAQTQLTNLSTSITNILNGTSAFTGTVGFVNATFSGTTTTTGTATFNGILTTKGQYLKSCAPIQTTSFTILSSLMFENYPINITATSTVTLPAASAALLGVTIRFRRVAGSAVALNSASSNIYPATSFTASAVLLTASNTASVGNSVQVVCLQLSATPTYGWFHAA